MFGKFQAQNRNNVGCITTIHLAHSFDNKKKKKFKYKIKNKKHKMPKEDSLVPRLKMATTIHKENQLHFLTA